MTSVARKYATFTAHEKPVTGDVKMSFVGYDHLGWIKCDGRSLSTSQFNLLFQVIGYTFGGSSNSFNLPDNTGRITGSSGPGYPAGTSTGSATHTLNIDEMPEHNLTGTTDPDGTHGHTGTTDPNGLHAHTGNTSVNGLHSHTGNTSVNGLHSHTTNAIGGQGNSGLVTADGTQTVIATDNSTGELNVWTLPIKLDINTSGNHQHTLNIDTSGNHQHMLNIDTSGNHVHNFSIDPVTDHTHTFTTNNIGSGVAFSIIQPTVFIGNTFIYSGIPTYPGFPPNPNSAWPYTIGLTPPLI